MSVFLALTEFRLENALRSFACLTVGDIIAITYNKKVSYMYLILINIV